MSWLALTVELDAAACEALSDALLEHGAQSVSVEAASGMERRRLCALLAPQARPEAVLRQAAAACALPVPAFDLSRVEDEDWVRRSQSQFEPLRLERLWVGPSWLEAPPGLACVRIDPGLAFGTGSHPSTRLILRFLDQRLRGGESVLDYGCGSGILALAAARLGARHAAAVDIDPQALETARANAVLNGLRLTVEPPEAIGEGRYDIVMANILSQPLVVLAPVLAARLGMPARLLLSGILESQADEVIRAYTPLIALRTIAVEEGWALVGGER